MKKLILCVFIPAILLLSCATTTIPQISDNDERLQMIGGKEALLDAIVYPDFALRKGIEGVVKVMAYIDTSGRVLDCEIIEGNDYLNEAAIIAIKSQKFHPYYTDGKLSPVRVAMPISFSITNDIDMNAIEDERLMPLADSYLSKKINRLGDEISSRSPGNKNEYYSEGLSWWPILGKADEPYIIKEGKLNPQAFAYHREALKTMHMHVSSLSSLYLVTGNKVYAKRATDYIKVWFVDKNTAMTPHMKYAQSIPNRSRGRATGIYEAMPLIEVVRSIKVLRPYLSENELLVINEWFKAYSKFLVYDEFGMQLRSKKNAYGVAWLAQISTIAEYLGDKYLLKTCREYFEEITIPYVLSQNSKLLKSPTNLLFEHDLLLHADYLVVIATVLSDENYSAWEVMDEQGRRIGDLVNYIYSGVLNNRIYLGEHYKGRFASLYLAGKAYDNFRYLDLWRSLQNNDVEIDFPVRELLLW